MSSSLHGEEDLPVISPIINDEKETSANSSAQVEGSQWHLESLSQDGHIDYDYNTGISHAVGGVLVTFEEAVLIAD